MAEPAARPFREHLGKSTGHVPGGFPVTHSSLDLPAHHENLGVKTIQPDDPLRLRLGFEGVSQFKPADGKIQVMPFRVFKYLHELFPLAGNRHAKTGSTGIVAAATVYD